MKSISPNRRWLVGAALSAGLLLAACGNDDGGNSATPQVVSGNGAATDGDGASDGAAGNDVSAEELALDFADCVRGEGVDWPDPITLADGSIDLLGGQGREAITGADGFIDEATQAALDTCSPIIEGSSLMPGADDIDAETQDQLLEFAQCLRDNGVDVDDPDLSVIGDRRGPAAIFGSNFDPSDTTTQDAIGACQSLFAGGLGSQGG